MDFIFQKEKRHHVFFFHIVWSYNFNLFAQTGNWFIEPFKSYMDKQILKRNT